MNKAVTAVIVAYIVALVFAVLTGYLLKDMHPLIVIGASDFVATVVIFAFSRTYNNSSFYDAYWSVIPPLIAAYWIWGTDSSQAIDLRQYIVLALVSIWGIRLTYNWARGWKGLHHQDWRYTDLQAKHGKAYWWVSFSGIHLFPTILVYAGCLPMISALSQGSHGFGLLDIIAIIVCGGGILIEGAADNQLRSYVFSNPPKGSTFAGGLWKYSRHPNYFGEMSFWWGLFLFGLAASPSYWWTIAGALSITLLFVFISLPMIDKRMLNRRPDYGERIKNVSAIVPLPPKK